MLPVKMKILPLLTLIPAISVAAATVWTGDIDTDWTNVSNWDDGLPGDAVFAGSPTANQPSFSSNQGVNTLTFSSAGWTIDANGNNLGPYYDLSSAGSGTNVINGNVSFGGNSGTAHTLNIGSGNTLDISGNFSWGGVQATTGSGTLAIGGSVTGFESTLSFSLFLNSASTITLSNGLNFESGSGFGGTANVAVNGYGVFAPGSGTFVSPGYAGTTPISSVTYTAGYASAGVNLTGSTLIMDIGTAVGTNDQIIVGSGLTRNGGFNLGSATLDLQGTGILTGAYTLLSLDSGTYTGTFGDIYYNGEEVIDDSVFQIEYTGSGVVLNVLQNVGAIPEPSALVFILGLSGLVFIGAGRRRESV